MLKGKIVVVVLVAVVMLFAVSAVKADAGIIGIPMVENQAISLNEYTQDLCNHYKWVNVPGDTSFSAVWLKIDPSILLAENTQSEISLPDGTAFVIAHSSIAVTGTLLSNTWGCRYGGSYFPPQDVVDEMIGGMNPTYCVYIDEQGEITSETPVGGTCILPETPPETPTATPTNTLEPTEPTITSTPSPTTTTVPPTPTPTQTLEPSPTPGYHVALAGGINTTSGWYGAQSGSQLQITTADEYDVVAVTYSNPGQEVQMRLFTGFGNAPVLTRGTYVHANQPAEWNSQCGSSGCWELLVLADSQGVVETATRMPPPGSLPGETVKVSVYPGTNASDGYWDSWTAVLSNGMTMLYNLYLPLILR